MPRINLFLLKKTDNAGLLVPPGEGGGATIVLDSVLDEQVYDKLLYFVVAVTHISRDQPVFLNGEIVGYAVADISPGSPLVYAEFVPTSWEMLWRRAMDLLSSGNYEEYPFQCIRVRLEGGMVTCRLPGSEKPVTIDAEASRRIMGVDPLEAPLPRFIGNIVSAATPLGLQGIYSYAPELVPYLAYLYRLMTG